MTNWSTLADVLTYKYRVFIEHSKIEIRHGKTMSYLISIFRVQYTRFA